MRLFYRLWIDGRAGGAGYGTVYELSPSKGGWTFKVIHTFRGGNDGSVGIGVSGLVLMDGMSAEQAEADFFCTCDDKLLKKSKKVKTPGTQVVSPLQLIAEVAP